MVDPMEVLDYRQKVQLPMGTPSRETNPLGWRILAAIIVTGLGMLCALPYHKVETPAPVIYRRGSAEDGARLMLRNQDIILQVSSRVEESPAPRLPPRNTSLTSDRRETIARDDVEQLPELPSQYRSLLDPNSTQPSASIPPAVGRAMESQPPPAFREHLIVNGDSIERLAERYLGSKSRSQEILELNRSVLGDGTLLPIGAVVRIPPRPAGGSVINDANSVFDNR